MRKVLGMVVLNLLLSACGASGGAEEPAGAATVTASEGLERPGRIGSHGMVLFGKESLFLSHIPMFARPHDVQLVLEVELTSSAVTLPAFDASLFTFLPSPLSLDALRLGSLHELVGSVYLGNFEDGGRRLATDVHLHVKRIVFQEVLDAAAPKLTTPEYLVVGSAADAYAVRHIGALARTNIDEVLAVTVPDTTALSTTTTPIWVKNTAFTERAQLSCLVGPDFVSGCTP